MRSAMLLLLAVVLSVSVPAIAKADPPGWRHHHRHRIGSHFRHNRIFPRTSTFSLSVGYGWPSTFYSTTYGYGGTYPYGGLIDGCVTIGQPFVYVVPPIVEPAEWHFGPQALDRFLGLNRNAGNPLAAQQPLLQPPALPNVPPPAADAVDGAWRKPDIRESNDQARERAGRFLLFGDNLFAEQQFHQALQRYKSAADSAPDLAEPYFRQGHALVATNRYDLAAEAFRRAMALSDDVQRAGFRLSDLYGDAELAKASHVEALAEAALNRPNDADPLFLLGLTLYYDGEGERARPFFERAAGLSQTASRFAKPYLDTLEAEQVVGIDL